MKNLFNRIALVFVTGVLGMAPAFAQQVKGQVLDTGGVPIIGAAVLVQGTSNGTMTDLDGN